VQLPGRGSRVREPAFTNMKPLVEAVAQALAPLLSDKPFAFFGHSMGASIGFELARLLRDRQRVEPACLFVSGRSAPQVPEEEKTTYNLPEAEFIEELRRLNGTPAEVLQHPELMSLMAPLLRADFETIETYRYEPGPPLTCPIVAVGGLHDEEVSREALEAWREQTRGNFTMHLFNGDHFFINTHQRELVETVARALYNTGALKSTI
jgi:medium-chain acyl-[acyl-carrier-protein] hydrolase